MHPFLSGPRQRSALSVAVRLARFSFAALVMNAALADAGQGELPPDHLAAKSSLMAPEVPAARTDDFDRIQERRTLRILVPYSRTYFHIERGQQKGLSYEFGTALESWLNRTYPRKGQARDWHVMFIPVTRDMLIPGLLRGLGDVAAGGLLAGDGHRLGAVAFADPFSTGVHQVIVTGPATEPLTRLDQLAGREVAVRAFSSHFWNLIDLSRALQEQGLPSIRIVPLSDSLEPEDLLAMVDAGMVAATVVDRYLATAWQPVLGNIRVHEELYLADSGEYAWALRESNPQLKAVLSAFSEEHHIHTEFGRHLLGRQIRKGRLLADDASPEEQSAFKALDQAFDKHAQRYGLDPLLLMAQAFQESRLDQRARSHRGAVGIMQILPSTAADPNVRVTGVTASADRNVEAASKYMRFLADTYLDDPGLTPDNKVFLLLAAYNAGPGNLRKIRRLAQETGLDPDVWFDNVEHTAEKLLGRETVNYVNSVYKYYVAYRLAEERQKDRLAAVAGRRGEG